MELLKLLSLCKYNKTYGKNVAVVNIPAKTVKLLLLCVQLSVCRIPPNYPWRFKNSLVERKKLVFFIIIIILIQKFLKMVVKGLKTHASLISFIHTHDLYFL